MNEINGNENCNYVNSRALFVLKIIAMSFAILACVVIVTVLLTRWITDLNSKIKESNTKVAKAAARLNKFRRQRIKHILKQRKLQLKQEKKDRRSKHRDRDKSIVDHDSTDEDYGDGELLGEEITDEDISIHDFDNELSALILGEED